MCSYLIVLLLISLCIIVYLLSILRRIKVQLNSIRSALEDIKKGNLNRRILSRKSDMTKQICYRINEIVMDAQSRLIKQKQSEQAYKRLMTSLSHDVKTPLASLVGYLEAIESNIVKGDEKDEYIHIAYEKSQNLKEFVEYLFEWVKLDSGEQVYHFELMDINELSRDIVAGWIPILERRKLEYTFVIPENECFVELDRNAYTRILNNVLQNIVIHSDGTKVIVKLIEQKEQIIMEIKDNGKGISSKHIPHIFERMYQCEYARTSKGNGLGLSIAKELVNAHKGEITVDSIVGSGSTFTVRLPKKR